jgi:hypothetical protein
LENGGYLYTVVGVRRAEDIGHLGDVVVSVRPKEDGGRIAAPVFVPCTNEASMSSSLALYI